MHMQQAFLHVSSQADERGTAIITSGHTAFFFTIFPPN